MNIPANTLSGIGYAGTVSRMNGNRTGKKEQKDRQKAEMSQEERMISQFKEEHRPEKELEQQIFGKFRAGKELSEEELRFLARNNPQIYKEVKEIMQERAAMEQQMEQAETKQQVAAVHANEMTYLKETMGTGEQAKSQAMKSMARVNQMDAAHVQFLATLEYREKEDEESQALEQREALLEAELKEAERQEELADSREPEKTAPEKENVFGNETVPGKEPAFDGESASDGTAITGNGTQPSKEYVSGARHQAEESRAEQAERELKNLEEQRRSKSARRHKRQEFLGESRTLAQEDYRQLRIKIRDLYRDTGVGGTSGNVDIYM